jgi:Zn-dependent protease with chaperone function
LIAILTIHLHIIFEAVSHNHGTDEIATYSLFSEDIFLINHIHSIHLFRIHLHEIDHMNINLNFSNHLITFCVNLAVFFTIVTVVAYFFIAFVLSQIILNIKLLKLKRSKLIDNHYQITNYLLSKVVTFDCSYQQYDLYIIKSKLFTAFSFSVIKFNKSIMKPLKIKNNIIISFEILNAFTSPEIEAIIAHEYSHLINHDTRYSHLIYTLGNMNFIDPFLKWVRLKFEREHELTADSQASVLIQNKKNLAVALFKVIELSKNYHSYRCDKVFFKERIEKIIG